MVAAAVLPDFFAGLFVERPDPGIGVGVAVLHDQIAHHDGTGGYPQGL